MKLKDQIEAMARADGRWVLIPRYTAMYGGPDKLNGHSYPHPDELPDYFTDNEVDRMVRLLGDEELFEYHCLCEELFAVIKPEWIHKLETAHKVEVYLKATGLWEEG